MNAAAPRLEIARDTFRSHFNRRPFLFGHRLAHHPLFELPRLAALSRALHGRWIEYNDGRLPVSVPNQADIVYTGLTTEESIRRTHEVCSWVALKRTEQFPEYAAVLDACLDEIAPLAAPLEPGMCEREAAIFVSSPLSVTPYHVDHEINFLLQLRGSKTVHVFDAGDRQVLTERELEQYFCGTGLLRNLRLRRQYAHRARVFELRAGMALHIPSTAPHWVENGAQTSVSLSVSFKTRALLRRADVHRMNALLRRLGFEPSRCSAYPARDYLKHQTYRALRRVRRLWTAQP